MGKTAIEWTHRPGTTGESWNILAGCSKVSPGCDNCYALSMSWRIQNALEKMRPAPARYEGVVQRRFRGPGMEHGLFVEWTGRVNLDWDALEVPYRWRKPRTVFVQSMGDLFHEKVPDEFINKVWWVMAKTRHTFLVLTKRAERMHRYLSDYWDDPPANVWLGVTAENQEQANFRIPLLLQTPAAVRWVSVEPMLGAISAWKYLDPLALTEAEAPWKNALDWVVIGCESGPNRRPMRLKWALDLIDQCDAARVPVFCKQIHQPDMNVSKDPSEWPTELQRREWPNGPSETT